MSDNYERLHEEARALLATPVSFTDPPMISQLYKVLEAVRTSLRLMCDLNFDIIDAQFYASLQSLDRWFERKK